MTKTLTPPRLQDLPPPPQGKTGWPWTEEVDRSGALPGEHHRWPWISVLIPSYNYGQFIEETVRSVLLQTYPYLECIVIDGGSTDQTLDIIKTYEPYLAYWESQPDGGQTDAINRGYHHCTGDIFVWLNADDLYFDPFVLSKVARLYLDGYTFIAGECQNVDVNGDYLYKPADGKSRPTTFRKYLRYWSSLVLQQPAVFIAKQLTDRGFPLETDLYYAMDYQLFLRVLSQNPKSIWIQDKLVRLRWHRDSKTMGDGSNRSPQEPEVPEVHRIALGESRHLPDSWQRLLFRVQAFDYLTLSPLLRQQPAAGRVLDQLWHRPTLLLWPLSWKILLRAWLKSVFPRLNNG